MKKIFLLVAFVVFSSSFFLTPLQAQDEVAEPAAAQAEELAADETEFSFGTVKSIGDNQLVVSEYDYESNADVDVTYQVPAETAFENVAALKDIAVGDSVDIDFLVEGDQKKAVAVTVEKPLTEDEEAALDAAPEEATE